MPSPITSGLKPADAASFLYKFTENDHPRDEHGRFASVANSSATVKHVSSPEHVEAASKAIFGRSLGHQELANLSGLPDGVAKVKVENGQIHIHTKGTNCDSKVILKHEGGKAVLVADEFNVSKKARGKGLGTDVMARTLKQAEDLKCSHIELFAAKSGGKNGYYTWPRLGYDAPLSEVQKSFYARALSRPCSSVSDVMQSQEGRDFWKERGTEMDMKFDLSPGSKSRKIWAEYLKQKANTNPTSPPKNWKPRIEPWMRLLNAMV